MKWREEIKEAFLKQFSQLEFSQLNHSGGEREGGVVLHKSLWILRHSSPSTGRMPRHYCCKKSKQNLGQATSTGFGNLKAYTTGDFNLNAPPLFGELLAKWLQNDSNTEKVKDKQGQSLTYCREKQTLSWQSWLSLVQNSPSCQDGLRPLICHRSEDRQALRLATCKPWHGATEMKEDMGFWLHSGSEAVHFCA